MKSSRRLYFSLATVLLIGYLLIGIFAIIQSNGLFHPSHPSDHPTCIIEPGGISSGANCVSLASTSPVYYSYLPWMQPSVYADELTAGFYVPVDLVVALLLLVALIVFLRPKRRPEDKLLNRGHRRNTSPLVRRVLLLICTVVVLIVILIAFIFKLPPTQALICHDACDVPESHIQY